MPPFLLPVLAAPFVGSFLGVLAMRLPDGRPAYDAVWVHGYASLNSLRAIFVAWALGTPVLLRAEPWLADRPRNGLTRVAKRLFFAALRPMVSAVLPIGSRNGEYWNFYFGDRVPQFPVPYAVDNEFFAAKARAAEDSLDGLRAELDLEPGRRVILFASKLQQRKHADHLMAAFAQLQALSMPGTGPYLLLAGEGEQRAALETQARDLGLTDVRFVGFQNQTALPRFFALADVFVLPARHEPWGLVVNEVMATGTPVVLSSDIGAAADLVTDGVEGYVYRTGDIAALAQAIRRVLASPETARTLGAAAAKRMAHWNFESDIGGLRKALAAVTHRLRP